MTMINQGWAPKKLRGKECKFSADILSSPKDLSIWVLRAATIKISLDTEWISEVLKGKESLRSLQIPVLAFCRQRNKPRQRKWHPQENRGHMWQKQTLSTGLPTPAVLSLSALMLWWLIIFRIWNFKTSVWTYGESRNATRSGMILSLMDYQDSTKYRPHGGAPESSSLQQPSPWTLNSTPMSSLLCFSC